MSSSVLIVYASTYGSTKKMAEAVAAGIELQGSRATIKLADQATAEDVTSHDALVLGSPVHMGSPDWMIKKFIDTVCSGLWMKDLTIGKVGAVFASGGGFGGGGGGAELTMLALLNNLVELGMLVVPLPKNTPGYRSGGLQWGPYGRSQGKNMEMSGLDEEVLEVARCHGQHIARAAAIFKGQKVFELRKEKAAR